MKNLQDKIGENFLEECGEKVIEIGERECKICYSPAACAGLKLGFQTWIFRPNGLRERRRKIGAEKKEAVGMGGEKMTGDMKVEG